MHGVCPICGESPLTSEQPFLFLKLMNLPRATSVSISALLQSHFSEGTEVVNMRCSNCCKNQNHKSVCPELGLCKSRGTVEKCEITKYPNYLFLQLVRNVGNQPKNTTHVTIVKQ